MLVLVLRDEHHRLVFLALELLDLVEVVIEEAVDLDELILVGLLAHQLPSCLEVALLQQRDKLELPVCSTLPAPNDQLAGAAVLLEQLDDLAEVRIGNADDLLDIIKLKLHVLLQQDLGTTLENPVKIRRVELVLLEAGAEGRCDLVDVVAGGDEATG